MDQHSNASVPTISRIPSLEIEISELLSEAFEGQNYKNVKTKLPALLSVFNQANSELCKHFFGCLVTYAKEFVTSSYAYTNSIRPEGQNITRKSFVDAKSEVFQVLDQVLFLSLDKIDIRGFGKEIIDLAKTSIVWLDRDDKTFVHTENHAWTDALVYRYAKLAKPEDVAEHFRKNLYAAKNYEHSFLRREGDEMVRHLSVALALCEGLDNGTAVVSEKSFAMLDETEALARRVMPNAEQALHFAREIRDNLKGRGLIAEPVRGKKAKKDRALKKARHAQLT